MSPLGRRVLLATGDVASLVVFTVIGLINHEDGVTVGGVLQVVLPIVAVGVVATWLFGTYRRPGPATLLPAWLVSVPAGLLIRKALFDTPATWSSTWVFLGVALAFTLLFLLAWRTAARFLLHLEPYPRDPSLDVPVDTPGP
jgi:O-antigen/teichoic acid export membrane protein